MTRSIRQFRSSAIYIAMALSLPMATALAQNAQVQAALTWSAVASNGTDMPVIQTPQESSAASTSLL